MSTVHVSRRTAHTIAIAAACAMTALPAVAVAADPPRDAGRTGAPFVIAMHNPPGDMPGVAVMHNPPGYIPAAAVMHNPPGFIVGTAAMAQAVPPDPYRR
jgi:hypothetical protein